MEDVGNIEARRVLVEGVKSPPPCGLFIRCVAGILDLAVVWVVLFWLTLLLQQEDANGNPTLPWWVLAIYVVWWLAYYFAFRVVGHWLSIRGARQGLGGIAWRPEASESLRELDAALTLEPAARAERVRELGERLQLPQLAAFLARVALRRP